MDYFLLWYLEMNLIPLLDWLSELITGLVIIFILVNAIKTNCFQPLDWGLTVTALLFGLFVKIIANLTK